jgi:mono/diheme cytochrome c family protein
MAARAAYGAICASLLLAAAPSAFADDAVSFKRDVEPILNKHCVQCHMVGTELGNFSLYPDPRGNMIGMQSTQCGLNLVEPGKPDQSYMLIKMLGAQATIGGKGARMPWEYDLDKADIEAVRRWILQGAADN